MQKIRPTTRDAIIEAAFSAYAENPAAALSDVAKRAGVGRATLHRHFPGRADLMRALAVVAIDELDEAVEAATANVTSATDGLRLALHAIVPLADRQWFLAQEGLEFDPSLAAAYQTSLDELRTEIDAAKAEGAFATDAPSVWIAAAYENLTYAAWSLVRSGEATPKQAADLAWRTLIQGLKGDLT